MGVGCSTGHKSILDQNFSKFMESFRAKYKAEGGPLTRELARSDEFSRQNILLFQQAHDVSASEQYKYSPDGNVKAFPPMFKTPKTPTDYREMISCYACNRNNKALLDLIVATPVSQEFLVSLLGAIEATDVVASLNITQQKFDAMVVNLFPAMLSTNKFLECLTLSNCGLTASSSKIIASAIKTMATNRLASLSARSLKPARRPLYVNLPETPSTTLSYHTVYVSLKYLDLSYNQLNDDGVTMFIESLQHYKEIEYLSLAATGCRDGGVAVLCEYLPYLKHLAYIDLSKNPGITSNSVNIFVHTLKTNQTIRQLDIQMCNVGENGQNLINYYICRNQIMREALNDLIDNAMILVDNELDGDNSRNNSKINIRNNVQRADQITGNPQQELVMYQEKVKLFHGINHTAEENILRRLQNTKASMQDLVLTEICHILANHTTVRASSRSLKPQNEFGTQDSERSFDAVLHGFSISQSETIGRRTEMEDVTMIIKDFASYRRGRSSYRGTRCSESGHKEMLLGIFDGHGGTECSTIVGDLFPIAFADALNSVLYAAQLNHAYDLPDAVWEPLFVGVFLRLDDTLRLKNIQSGSTAAVCFILDGMVISANCGDSRTILTRDEAMVKSFGCDSMLYKVEGPKKNTKINEIYSGTLHQTEHPRSQQLSGHDIITSARYFMGPGEIIEETLVSAKQRGRRVEGLALRLSKDHKPEDPAETRRIEASGGYVHGGRVMGTLSVCRSFGDFVYKPSISVVPFVSVYHFHKYDAWIVIACDGCWDSLSDVDAAMLLSTCLSSQAGALKLRDEAYRLNSQDNISVITVKLYLE